LQVIDGEYKVASRIGEGASGGVYRCEGVRLGPFRIKMLGEAAVNEREYSDSSPRPDFASLTTQTSSRSPPRTHEETPTSHGVAHRVTLRDLLRKERSHCPGLEIMRCVARGLAAIHERGIVHRDL